MNYDEPETFLDPNGVDNLLPPIKASEAAGQDDLGPRVLKDRADVPSLLSCQVP